MFPLLLILTLFTMPAVAQQQPQPQHKAPPADFFCSRDTHDRAHFCVCSGMKDNPACPMPHAENPPDSGDENEGIPSQPDQPPEDKHCTVYCYRDHCHCMTMCHDTRYMRLIKDVAARLGAAVSGCRG